MKVSVLVITYNHEEFIAQAIESVLAQEAPFDFEIVVGEDCSTDATRAILQELQRQHPEKIRLLEHESNLGMHGNFAATWAACQGQYVAMLEGDDVWTDSSKLLRQAELMDAHADCTLCHHNVEVFQGVDFASRRAYFAPGQPAFSGIEEFVSQHVVTCSAMVRRGIVGEIPAWTHELAMADFPFFVLHAQAGRVAYIDRAMAAYRMHAGGVFSLQAPFRNAVESIKMLEAVSKHLGYKHDAAIRSRVFVRWFDIVVDRVGAGDFASARLYGRKILRSGRPWQRAGVKARVAARLLAPRFFQVMQQRRAAR